MAISQSIYFSEKALRHLKALAKATGESLSETARRCIFRTSENDLLVDLAGEIERKLKERRSDSDSD